MRATSCSGLAARPRQRSRWPGGRKACAGICASCATIIPAARPCGTASTPSNWGETTTNNYGFAPAEGDHPQRFQHQMYRELLRLLKAKRPLEARPEIARGQLRPRRRAQRLSRRRARRVRCDRARRRRQARSLSAARPMAKATGGASSKAARSTCRSPTPASMSCSTSRRRTTMATGRASSPRSARVLKPDGVFLYTDSFRAGARRADEGRSWRAPDSPPISPTSPATSPRPAGSTARAAAN